MSRHVVGMLAASVATALVLAACSTSSAGPTGTPAGGGGGGTATGGAQPPGGNGGNGDVTGLQACSMLTPAEIQSAVGQPMKAGVEQDTDTQVACDWESEDGNTSVGVTVAKFDADIWNTLSSSQYAKSVSGLGEAAYSGFPHAGDLSIKVNGYDVGIGVVDFTSDPAKVDAADMTLAGLVLSRL